MPNLVPQIWFRSNLDAKNFRRSIWYKIANQRVTRPKRSDFSYERILEDSISWTRLLAEEQRKVQSTVPISKYQRAKTDALIISSGSAYEYASSTDKESATEKVLANIPDEPWWKKLCKALQDKYPQLSNYGAHILREKVIRTFGGRILFEDLYEKNKEEIERFYVHEPVFVVGLPRANAAMAYHMNARSGQFLALRTRDTMFPAFPAELERNKLTEDVLKFTPRVFPQLQSIFQLQPDIPDSDVNLQMMCPRSLCWGLLHGLPDYLYECKEEDQEHVFDFEHRAMKVFQWYRQLDEFHDCVKKEINESINPYHQLQDGRKLQLDRLPWLIHSPFALLHIEQLHKVFPDMRLIWCHRAISQCVASTCASFAIHNSIYTGESPTTAQLCNIGETMLGIFGSGSEHAVDYLSTFPYERMVHWHNRDIARSGTRLATKTLDAFDIETDRYHTHAIVDGMTEWNGFFRPKLDSELSHFGLHEGVVGEAFQAYIQQFEEYAYEAKFGIKVQDYVLMGADYAKQRYGTPSLNAKDRQTSFGMFAAPGGGHESLADHAGQSGGVTKGIHARTGPHD